MDAYTYLSGVYDDLMDDIPYKEWGGYIITLLSRHGIKGGLLLDLGCGSGIMSELLSGYGYEVIGVDVSSEMLSAALDKKAESKSDILYLCQDMRELELYGTVRAVVSVCDSINYLLDIKDLVKVFKLVNNYLDPKGIFIFDINTPAKYEQMGDQVIAENRERCSFIWENDYDKDKHVNQYCLTIFIKDECGKYDKVEETHYQRGYTNREIRQALEEAGLEYIDAYDSYSGRAPGPRSERICFVARESGKIN